MHAEAHRPMETPTPQYFSRHYYDFAMLFDTEEGKQAATDFGLLTQVVTHKATFFRSNWARYDLAKPGTLQFIRTRRASRICALTTGLGRRRDLKAVCGPGIWLRRKPAVQSLPRRE
ncbi:hypothetical protein [Cupriavidus sp. amp6]|uniref:hypothetical protein n=1 Tax=Cupriavidus sp. amp6 TaxID=388051 RepID=UPI001E4EBB6B|nr:hypothetical protein [Cupriavidus sp. amp6]